ncbi:CCA tRNA nucleotidyltransferase [Methanopyrus sp. KOL6]|uniref:CCA tRNA nucleotidyltransferase n=1 Tax=Methanopyrus sp. KOL6 TaxID=1937004 RepID=UPI000B4AFEE7|nr:CCA tRNA nucleotidyltransferase [Methanopyrus sp. KOL6]
MILEEVLDEVRREVTPDPEEREVVEGFARRVLSEVRDRLKGRDPDAEVELIGSVARDTWLPGASDIDVFCVFPKDRDLDEIVEITLEVGREAIEELGGEALEEYANHPYIGGEVEYRGRTFEVDVVPCYDTEPGEVITPVDRTPHHNRYVKERLENTAEVRLLKAFVKAIDAYGAEARVKGFSGYLCELLVIHYGSFKEVLREAVMTWRPGFVIDLEGFVGEVYEDYGEVREKFEDQDPALIVLDPVDPQRNVAAALSKRQLTRFILAARAFLKDPSPEFFRGRKFEPASGEEIRGWFEKNPAHVVAIEVRLPDEVEDIYWPQLEKTARSLSKVLENEGFEVRRWYVMRDSEEEHGYVLLEFEHGRLPVLEWRVGPAGWVREDRVRGFVRAHGRFWVEDDGKLATRAERKFVRPEDLLRRLEGADRQTLLSHGFGKDLARSSEGEVRLLSSEELAELADRDPELGKGLAEFMRGDPLSELVRDRL